MNSAALARPERLVVIAGTGTEIGKTRVASELLRHARSAGITVATAPGSPTASATTW